MKKKVLARGVEVITYAPPSGFDPTAASAAELKRYGFPAYPEHPHARRYYQRVWRSLRTKFAYVRPTFRVDRDVVFGPPGVLATIRNVVTSNWSGATVNTDMLRPYHFCGGGFVVPRISAPTDGKTYHAGIWIGIDSAAQRQVLQGGVGCNVRGTASPTTEYYVWFEWYPGPSVRITNFPVVPGDRIEVIVCASPLLDDRPHHVGAGTLTYINRTTGVTTAVTVMAPDGFKLFGETAEWIVEAPTVATGQTELPNYGGLSFKDSFAMSSRTVDGAGTGDVYSLQGPRGNIVSDCRLLTPTMVRCAYTGP